MNFRADAAPTARSRASCRVIRGRGLLLTTNLGFPLEVTSSCWPLRGNMAGREFADGVTEAEGSGLNDAGVEAAEAEVHPNFGIHEGKGVRAEARFEFRAAGVRIGGDFEDNVADLELRAWREVVGAEIEIDIELVAGDGPGVAGTGYGGDGARVHDGDLAFLVWAFPGAPAIAEKGAFEIKGSFGEDLALACGRAADDEFEHAGIGGSIFDVGESGFELQHGGIHARGRYSGERMLSMMSTRQWQRTCCKKFTNNGIEGYWRTALDGTSIAIPARRCMIRYLLLAAVALNVSLFAAGSVRINEFMASNDDGLADEDGDFSDWIELYNAGDTQVDLGEWSLTDDPENLRKWEFPSVLIEPRGFVVVFASSKDRNLPKLHANFNLAEEGEYLALVRPDGTIATEFNPGYPGQQEDVSYGYAADGTLAFFPSPTPTEANEGSVVNFVADTKFNPDRGFFEAPFDLAITTATPGATIRYTTNGIPPTATTGIVYSGPVRISGTTTIRAAAFLTGYIPSDVDTQTYIFLNDVIRQSPTGAPPPGWPSSWGANAVDYGMDPDIVNSPRYRDTIKSDLKSLPSFSIVMNLADLFDSTRGIYANPGQDGIAWERQCSMELIYPDGREGFQVNAGIRIRGGFSRSTRNPKHAFRFFFRQEYGDGKLNYPLFGENGASEFDKIDLRTFQNYSWSFDGSPTGVFLRDQFSRDTQLEMGHQAERGDFYHLYINGQYWGLFNTCERPEAAYGETYFGGAREDYDTIKVEPYNTVATDGTMDAWVQLYNMAKAGLATTEAYQRVQGNNPDGTPNAAYPVLIDIENLIDYMLLIVYTGNIDAPISNFLGNDDPNNFYSLRNRRIEARMGFVSFAHDAEHTLLVDQLNTDRTGPFPAGDSSVSKSNPQWIWQKLQANAEFRLRVADRIHRYFFNGGLLTPQANIARFMKRKAEIDRAVVAESARWGDAHSARRTSPLNRDDHWVPAINNVVNNYFPHRTARALNHLKAKNLYPQVAAPVFAQHGGNVPEGFRLSMSSAAGDIYYTLDGSDPRLMGGNISPKAVRYSGAVTLADHVRVKARTLANGVWSALNEAQFTIARSFSELLITELMYNPPRFGEVDGEELEFVELKNSGTSELLLSGLRFTNGLDYTFPAGARLAPGAFYLLVRNPEQFTAKYPGVRVDGVYTNRLSNGGETVALVHAAGTPIAQFTYNDQSPWPTAADGAGFSLVPRQAQPGVNLNLAASWRSSAEIGGSPGRDDPGINLVPVVINEVLTHTDLPVVDAVELHNPAETAADISGWYLSDDPRNPRKFRLPANSIIPAGGYVVLDETQFNATAGAESFSFSSRGDEVLLSAANADGTLAGYTDVLSFRAAENGVTFGRHTNSVGEVLFPAQVNNSLGKANAGPRVGPVVINEVRYAPGAAQDEFIELRNVTGEAVPLYDPNNPTNTWRIEAISYQFPTGTELPPFGRIVVSETEPTLFRRRNNLPAQIAVLGPFAGTLQDNGELIELVRPDAPEKETNGTEVVTVVPYIVVDAVRYGTQLPWPTNVAGTDASLERLAAGLFGNEPANWRGSPGAASPGVENDGNRVPHVDAGVNIELLASTFPVATNLTAVGTDDGKVNSALIYRWRSVSGPGVVQIQNATQAASTFLFPGVGIYELEVTVNDGEFSVSDIVTVTVTRPLADTPIVPAGSVWKFLDNGSDQGTAWRAMSFNDAGWKSGPGRLGYGEPPSRTSVFPGTSAGRYITTYFRGAFTVTGARQVVSLTAKIMRDDGAVVYLNGTEVFRSNMPQGTINYLTPASNVVGGGDESAYFEHTVDPALLREGNNVLAVEVHQQNTGSSDLGFDLELVGRFSSSNRAPTASAGPDLALATLGPVLLDGSVTDDGLPNPPGVFNATWNILSGPGSVAFENVNAPKTSATFSQGGTYQLRLSVTDGELTASDDLQVVVTAADPFTAWREANFSAAELAEAGVSGENADPDRDQFTNREEFIAGTRPKDSASYLHVAEVGREDDDVVIRFEAVGDRSYAVEARANAEAGTWERIVDLAPQGTDSMIDVLDPMETRARRIYRIVTPLLPEN